MTMSLWVSAADVRTYVGNQGSTGRYSDTSLGSNIRAAQTYFQRETSRLFEVQTGVTKKFTSEGRAQFAIPDLRTVTSASMQGSALTADTTYWLIPDTQWSGVYVALQLRPFGNADYRSNPDWFDRNLDQPWARGFAGSLPNDVSITADWGWVDKPDDVLLGVKAMAAWITKRADAVLAGAVQTPEGSMLDYSLIPPEMTSAIRTYRRGEQAGLVDG